MTREEASKLCLKECDKHKCVIAELPTGYGKSYLSIQMVNHICDRVYKEQQEEASVLIVIAKKVHKQNWLEEIDKWGGLNTSNVEFTCYESLKKYEKLTFDIILLDEAHHIKSEIRRDLLKSIYIDELLIGLSATIPLDLKEWFNYYYDTKIVSCDLQNAIEEGVLPEPNIYLIPLELNNKEPTESLWKNTKSKGKTIECCWNNRWHYIRQKKCPVRIYCTELQYLADLNGQIEWFKNKSHGNKYMETKWLRLCGERLKWLSDKKTPFIKLLLDQFRNYRTLTFCNSIEHTEELGKNCIHSKNSDSQDIIDKFNNKKIKHITSCQMLNEGMNLVDCRIGIYANINSSERINKQKFGRLLRHKHPIIIIPYYKNTREEEIVKDIIKDYNPELINIVNNIKDIKL